MTSRVISTPVRVSSRPATPSALLRRARTSDSPCLQANQLQLTINTSSPPPPCYHYTRTRVRNHFTGAPALETSNIAIVISLSFNRILSQKRWNNLKCIGSEKVRLGQHSHRHTIRLLPTLASNNNSQLYIFMNQNIESNEAVLLSSYTYIL